MASEPIIKMSLHLSLDNYTTLERLCNENKMNKSNVLRKALHLIDLAWSCKKEGNHLIVVDINENKVSDLMTLYERE